jgi:hypothetical protein
MSPKRRLTLLRVRLYLISRLTVRLKLFGNFEYGSP